MRTITGRGEATGHIQGRMRRRRWPHLVTLPLLCALLGHGVTAFALGLGQATVQSFLQQPLDARIDLISRSEAEMATVTAALASPADFQVMGLTRADIAAPLEFTVNRDLADPHIRVTSSLPMNEPVVQLVVEVVWASGRMLRQYTLFLDPPTFSAPAPLPATPARALEQPQAPAQVRDAEADVAPVAGPEAPVVTPAAEPTVTDAGPPFAPAPIAENDDAPGPAVADPVAEQPAATETPASGSAAVAEPDSTDSAVARPDETASAEPAAAEPVPDVEVADGASEPARVDPVPTETAEGGALDTREAEAAIEEPDPALTPPPVVAEEAPTEPASYRAVLPDPGEELPGTVAVKRGDTLWSLSQELAREQGTDVNQVMLAVQQNNPDAFIGGNINRLMAGAVLRMPTRDEAQRLSARAAMLEVMRQESLYRNRGSAPVTPEQVPTVTNLAEVATPPEDEPVSDPSAPTEPETPESRLELVPPSDDEELPAEALGQGGSGETAVSQGESVVSELARTQEELANAQQENAYLADRIAELEAELARREAPEETGVADTNLAEMEDRLREERAAEAAEPELALTEPDAPASWLERFGGWLLGLVVVLVAGLVVFLRRRQQLDVDDAASVPQEPATTPDAASGNAAESPAAAPPPLSREPVNEEAEVADLDDPEARLDLARAYLAMGKTEQARDILAPVIEEGTPAQAREARDMLAGD